MRELLDVASENVLDITFLDGATFWPETRLRPPAFPHRLTWFDRTPGEEIVARVSQADIVITNKVPISAETLAAAPRLRMVAVAATGYDVVDTAACRERGVIVSNIRDYATASVPEHVFALILALRRSLLAYREAVLAGRWQESGQFCFLDFPIRDLAGSTIGIIGAGALGSRVARIAAAFGMDVLLAARKGASAGEGRTAFAEVLARSDVISLHCPLTPETQGLIAGPEFAAMARQPLLINTARGGLVDGPALVEALDRGLIAGAGIDVADREPPAPDDLLMELAQRSNVILTPHVGWASQEAVQRLADQLIDNIEAFVAGAPKNRVA